MRIAAILLRPWQAFGLAAVIVTLLFTPALAEQQDGESLAENILRSVRADIVPGRFIVMLKDGSVASPASLSAEYGFRTPKLYSTLGGFSASMTAAQAKALAQDPRVALVEPDVVVYAFAQTLPTGVNRIDGELSPTANINGVDQRVNVDIAIIDTGARKNHKDLNVFRQVNFTNEFFSDDMNGHGTHVAGTAAALDNTIGVVGVAPGARIWALKVLDRNGSGYLSDVIQGIDYVTANASQIEVANMSLGCECANAAMDAAITRSVAAGVVYVVAAGNSAKNSTTFSPANHPDVITVSAVADFNGLPGGGASATCYSDTDDTFANFSNYGAPVDIAAPGVCIYSTWRDGNYRSISGTSMASPHVAGAAALYLATNPKPTDAAGVAGVKAALIAAATAQGGVGGFSGDPDAFAEPLLNTSGF